MLKELSRLEKECVARKALPVAGVDEVGYGAWAGPLVVAAVLFEQPVFIAGVKDSKKLTPEKRKQLAEVIKEKATSWCIKQVEARDIERGNLRELVAFLMEQSVAELYPPPQVVISDAVKLNLPCTVVVENKADSNHFSVACASIIAKVYRDTLMEKLSDYYPQYNFASNKGYPSREHLNALAKFGPCKEHRLTFKGVIRGYYSERNGDFKKIVIFDN